MWETVPMASLVTLLTVLWTSGGAQELAGVYRAGWILRRVT